jgi:hypothetical protein
MSNRQARRGLREIAQGLEKEAKTLRQLGRSGPLIWRELDRPAVAYGPIESGLAVFGAAALVPRHGEPTGGEKMLADILDQVVGGLDKRVLLEPE